MEIGATAGNNGIGYKKIHKLCFQPSEGEMAGHYRTVNVIITGSQYNDRLSACENVSDDMLKLVGMLQSQREKLHPVEYAEWLHRSFIMIHPFSDGNGRVARLLLNHALISQGFPSVIILPMFKYDYIRALE